MVDIVSDSSSTIGKMEQIDIERRKYTTRGLSGYINIGNTCYMNAALQAFCATDLLITYFLNDKSEYYYKNDLKHGCIIKLAKKYRMTHDSENIELNVKDIKIEFKKSLTYKFRNILLCYWRLNCRIKPKQFKKSLGDAAEIFRDFSQNDSHECISYIIDRLHEETKTDVIIKIHDTLPKEVLDYINNKNKYFQMIEIAEDKDTKKLIHSEYIKYRLDNLRAVAISESLESWKSLMKKNHSIITDIFTSLYYNDVTCLKCKNVNFRYEINNTLTLEIPDMRKVSLYDCLDTHFVDTVLSDESAYECCECNEKCDAVKRIKFWHTPARLIISLKRFMYHGSRTMKNNKDIDFPITDLNLSKYISEYTGNDAIYNLYSVVHHYGGPSSGHYVAHTKNHTNNEWYLYDDSNVLHIPADKIESKLIDSSAYVLFYEKSTKVTISSSLTE